MSKVIKKTLESGIINTNVYWDDGSLRCEHYVLNDKLHREDGPARISYHRDGSKYESYWLNDKAHNKKDYEAWRLNKEADECINKMLVGGINE